MSGVTQILGQIEAGDPRAATQLLPLVYDELRQLAAARLAHEKPGQTLQATALVTFAPGQTTKTITIEVKGDSKKESTETFYLDQFANSGNSSFTKNRGIGTILNDD